MVAIIDEGLPGSFKTKNAIGKKIDFFGATFRIIGVIKDDSIIEN